MEMIAYGLCHPVFTFGIVVKPLCWSRLRCFQLHKPIQWSHFCHFCGLVQRWGTASQKNTILETHKNIIEFTRILDPSLFQTTRACFVPLFLTNPNRRTAQKCQQYRRTLFLLDPSWSVLNHPWSSHEVTKTPWCPSLFCAAQPQGLEEGSSNKGGISLGRYGTVGWSHYWNNTGYITKIRW